MNGAALRLARPRRRGRPAAHFAPLRYRPAPRDACAPLYAEARVLLGSIVLPGFEGQGLHQAIAVTEFYLGALESIGCGGSWQWNQLRLVLNWLFAWNPYMGFP